jgi:hypothetical protein
MRDPGEEGETLQARTATPADWDAMRARRDEEQRIRASIAARAESIKLPETIAQQRRVVALKQAVKTVNLAPGFAADEGELARAVLSMARLYESWLKDGANPE